MFADLVEARSDGRVKVTLHFEGALGGERETFEAVKLGDIESGTLPGLGGIAILGIDLDRYNAKLIKMRKK